MQEHYSLPTFATDDEIDIIANIYIERIGGFAPNCKYLLNHQHDDWYVAYTPPVTTNKDKPIHTYLSQNTNSDFLEGNYALNEVKSKLTKPGDKAKITFPPLSVLNDNVNDLSNHLITIEIQIERTQNNHYKIHLYSHDPYGDKYPLPLVNQHSLVEAISKTSGFTNTSFFGTISPYQNINKQGEDDGSSCGYICIDECFNSLINIPLTADPRYQNKVRILRLEYTQIIKNVHK